MFRRSHADIRSNPATTTSPAPVSDLLGLTMNAPELPEITITAKDAMRLGRLVDDFFQIRDRDIAFLARELDRANVVHPADLPRRVVTMRSLVEFWNGGRQAQAMLVYPAEASVSENKISVLTPVGTALLGLSEGQSMSYEDPDGSMRRVIVNRVLFQPEAEGMDWL